MQSLSELQIQAEAEIAAAQDLSALDAVRVRYLGKKGELTARLKGLSQLSAADRPAAGQEINKAKKELVTKFSSNILIVGHGASVFGATKGFVPDTPEFKVSLCCLTKVVRTPEQNWQLELCGDTSHLSQTESQVRLN